ncbi:nucleoside deaminase [Roseomonas elaeocarpi]|uniref:Nucleoside deaminase n=1 Tax=Roseomonas elaeocarpi TaxID=907779 RepID=A0ABV6JTP1_9PROT
MSSLHSDSDPGDAILSHEEAMRLAIRLSRDTVASGGGPFGAVILREGRVIGQGANRVVPDADPTAHAEVVAIRDACRREGTHDLSGAVLYTSCEPCPMCLSATWWARISTIHYANERTDAAAIGFDDAAIYEEVCRPIPERALPLRSLLRAEAIEVFQEWHANEDRKRY